MLFIRKSRLKKERRLHLMGILMKKGKHSRVNPSIAPAVVMLVLFAALIACLAFVDRQPIAADGSLVGLGTVNSAFHQLTGVSWTLYSATEAGGYVAIASMLVFFVIGVVELVRGRGFGGVDKAIYLIAVAYVIMLAAYVGFDKIALNYRPVLVDGALEPSFPSSHAFLAVGTMGCAITWAKIRLGKGAFTAVAVVCTLLALFVVVGRLLSGVHWLTDILGGVLLGFTLVFAYRYLVAKVA